MTPLQKCGRFGQINCCPRLVKVAQSPINRPIWTQWREPWSSGYGRRPMSFRSWVWILVLFTRWTFSHYFVVKFVSIFFKCFISIFMIFQLSQTAQIYKLLTNDSINICVSSLNFILFWKLLSVDVVLELKKFCPHWGLNLWPRVQHSNVLSWVLYHSAIQAPHKKINMCYKKVFYRKLM